MNCQEFWDHMPEIGADTSELGQHAAECAACAEQLKLHRALASGLRSVAEQMGSVEAPARVEQGLIAAFRSQNRVRTRTASVSWWAPVLSWAGAAAVLVVGAGLLLHSAHTPQPLRARPGTPSIEQAVFDPSASSDNDDGFIPLPNAETLDPDEDVNVVRMEVPRSTMMAVGLPVSTDRLSELVEADVVLGQDGMARAIRFVDE